MWWRSSHALHIPTTLGERPARRVAMMRGHRIGPRQLFGEVDMGV